MIALKNFRSNTFRPQPILFLFNIDKIKGDFTGLMQAKNIYVQFREHFGGKWCRVSMGTTEEMQKFCAALKAIAS